MARLEVIKNSALNLWGFLRKAVLPRWDLLLPILLVAWAGLAPACFLDSSDPDTVQVNLNEANQQYLQVQLDFAEFDPSTKAISTKIMCWLPLEIAASLRQVVEANDEAYDVRLHVMTSEELDAVIRFDPPPQSPGSKQSIVIFARGVEGDIIADATQLAQGSIESRDVSINPLGDFWWCPFDRQTLRLEFAMVVPPNLTVDGTAYDFGSDDSMPCYFTTSHVDGNYSCTVGAAGNNILVVQFDRPWTYRLLAMMPMLALVLLGLLTLFGREASERGRWVGLWIAVLLAGYTVTRYWIIAKGISVPTLYDLLLLCGVFFFGAAWWLSSKRLAPGHRSRSKEEQGTADSEHARKVDSKE